MLAYSRSTGYFSSRQLLCSYAHYNQPTVDSNPILISLAQELRVLTQYALYSLVSLVTGRIREVLIYT